MYLPDGEDTVRCDCVTAASALADQIKPTSTQRQVPSMTFTRTRPPHLVIRQKPGLILPERQAAGLAANLLAAGYMLICFEQALPRKQPALVVPPAGFEPAISCVKGRRPRPLDHGG
jgi:hypothetical protein